MESIEFNITVDTFLKIMSEVQASNVEQLEVCRKMASNQFETYRQMPLLFAILNRAIDNKIEAMTTREIYK